MRYWVDIPDDDELVAVDASSAVVMESGALVFFDQNSNVIAAFNEWNNMVDDATDKIEVE